MMLVSSCRGAAAPTRSSSTCAPADHHSTQFHLNPATREAIGRGSAAMKALPATDGTRR